MVKYLTLCHQLIFLAYDSLRLFNLANTSLTESLHAEEMCVAYRAWACVISACVPKLKVTYGILWGNLRCYMILRLYHLHMLILKSLALPKVLMLSVVWVSAKPPITPHCLERLEFSLYMSALARWFYLCTSVSSMPNHQSKDLISISWPDIWQVTVVYLVHSFQEFAIWAYPHLVLY